jgi:hypothetical protein
MCCVNKKKPSVKGSNVNNANNNADNVNSPPPAP